MSTKPKENTGRVKTLCRDPLLTLTISVSPGVCPDHFVRLPYQPPPVATRKTLSTDRIAFVFELVILNLSTRGLAFPYTTPDKQSYDRLTTCLITAPYLAIKCQ